MTTAKPLAVALLSLFAACSGSEPLGPPDADELADLGVEAVPAYAAQLASTLTMCETLADGECDPDGETNSVTVEIKAAVDVSGGQVLPCSIAVRGEKKTHELENVRRAPNGAAQSQLVGSNLDLRLAFLFGVELADPFAENPVLADGAADHDGDGKSGVTFNTPGPGSVQFGARLVVDVPGIDATAAESIGDATLVALDYEVFGDTIPLVNVQNRVADYMDENKLASDESSAFVTVIDAASCEAVDGVLP